MRRRGMAIISMLIVLGVVIDIVGIALEEMAVVVRIVGKTCAVKGFK